MRRVNRQSIVRLPLALLCVVLGSCATAPDASPGSSPADKLQRPAASHELHGDLEVTISRTR